jgi:hypothetical protein
MNNRLYIRNISTFVNGCQWLSMVVNGCQWLSMVVNGLVIDN